MQTYRLRHRDHTTLFEGEYRTYRECIEDALLQGICLNGANFAHTDLSEINLDGTRLHEVCFMGANLTGANISEAELHHCQFDDASLFNVCFAQSDLTGSIFSHASFGGTDIAGAILDDCLFAGLSALGINFQSGKSMRGTSYQAAMRRCEMSIPPVVVSGLSETIAVFDQDILIGTALFSTANSIWLRDTSPANNHHPPEVTSDLYKSLSLLQRLKSAYADRQIVDSLKSTKS